MVLDQIGSPLCPVSHRAPFFLGPLLFSLQINEIMSDVESELRLFADECFCYPEIKDMESDQN